jgi:hypothetical protein
VQNAAYEITRFPLFVQRPAHQPAVKNRAVIARSRSVIVPAWHGSSHRDCARRNAEVEGSIPVRSILRKFGGIADCGCPFGDGGRMLRPQGSRSNTGSGARSALAGFGLPALRDVHAIRAVLNDMAGFCFLCIGDN